MEIAQRRNSNRIRYVFGEDELQYHLQDSSGSRSFNVAYTAVTRDRQALVERNAWLRNAGLFWIVLGVIVTGVHWFSDQQFRPSIWLLVGAITYAAYRLRSTPFIILPTEKGNLLVIDDDDGRRIIEQIEARRAAAYRAEYDFLPENETADQHRRRFEWLHREGAISSDDLRERLERIEAMEPFGLSSIAERPDGARLN